MTGFFNVRGTLEFTSQPDSPSAGFILEVIDYSRGLTEGTVTVKQNKDDGTWVVVLTFEFSTYNHHEAMKEVNALVFDFALRCSSADNYARHWSLNSASHTRID